LKKKIQASAYPNTTKEKTRGEMWAVGRDAFAADKQPH